MALSAAQIVTRACEIAAAPGFTEQGQQFLNAILSDLCQTYDLSIARGLFTFAFNPRLAGSMIGGQNIGASGPYPLPSDYLRTSGSSGSEGTQKSTFWLINGVPYPMVPCDLAEFDMQVQQVGISAFPWLWATDMSQRTVALSTFGNIVAGTPEQPPGPGFVPAEGGGFVPAEAAGTPVPSFVLAEGGGFVPAEGGGFVPAEPVPAGGGGFVPAEPVPGIPGTPATITNLASFRAIEVGMYVSGPGLSPLTVVTGIIGDTVTISPEPLVAPVFVPAGGGLPIPAEGGGFVPAEAAGNTLSVPLIFGHPAVGYAYPPPSGGFPVTLRYQRQMPDIVFADAAGNPTIAAGQPPWFLNQRYLIQQLSGMLMETTDDARADRFLGGMDGIGAEAILNKYLKTKDDDTNRTKVVGLDRRRFGKQYPLLRKTKQVGW